MDFTIEHDIDNEWIPTANAADLEIAYLIVAAIARRKGLTHARISFPRLGDVQYIDAHTRIANIELPHPEAPYLRTCLSCKGTGRFHTLPCTDCSGTAKTMVAYDPKASGIHGSDEIVCRHATREVWYDGTLLDPVPSLAIRNHSPTGFSWGYRGSGAAQLALAIVLKLIPEPNDASSLHRGLPLYQGFKETFIAHARIDEDLRIPIAHARRWIDARLAAARTGEENDTSPHERQPLHLDRRFNADDHPPADT